MSLLLLFQQNLYQFAATSAAVQAKDQAAIVAQENFTASAVNLVQAKDICVIIDAEYFVVGPAALIQAKDLVAITGTESFTTAPALTQRKDTTAITGAESFSAGATSFTQRKDTTLIAGFIGSGGTVSAVQKKDTAAISGTEAFTVSSAAITQRKDQISILGSTYFGAVGTIVQKKDTMSATGSAFFAASAPIVQRKDQFAAIAALKFTVAATTLTQAKDRFAGIAANTYVSSVATTQHKDTIASAAQVRYNITALIVQKNNIFAATDVETFFGAAPIVQRKDISNIIVQGLIIGTVATEQDPDQADIVGFNSKVGPVNISVFLAQEQAIRSAQVFSNGWIDYFDGPIPDLTESPPYGSTLLASGRLPAPLAKTVVDGVVTSYVFPLAYIFATGEAQWFRLYTEDHQTPLMDGLIGPGLGLSTTTFVAGETVEVDEFVFTIPGK